ncbi:MAG: DUF4383 domain-containing protein [Candidatus Limnocylindria bacterium]
MGLNRTVAGVFGVVYLVVGIYGFATVPDGTLLGLFDVNEIHHVVHIVLGAALLYGATSTPAAVMVNRAVGGVLIVVGLLGFVSEDGFGIMPLGGNDIWLHLVTGVILLAVGLMSRREMAAA